MSRRNSPPDASCSGSASTVRLKADATYAVALAPDAEPYVASDLSRTSELSNGTVLRHHFIRLRLRLIAWCHAMVSSQVLKLASRRKLSSRRHATTNAS